MELERGRRVFEFFETNNILISVKPSTEKTVLERSLLLINSLSELSETREIPEA